MDSVGPLVSVILPFFNSPYLAESVESILDQQYKNFELILIDNGSNDASSRLARSYTDHPKVKVLFEPERGVVFAANKGLQEAKGRFIARMDSDDIAAPDRLHLQVTFLQQNPALSAVSGSVEYMGSDINEGFKKYVNWMNGIRTPELIQLNQFVEFPTANPTLMFRREVFDLSGFYLKGDFPEDYEFFLRMQSKGLRIGKVDPVVLKWRDTATRLTRTDSSYSHEAFFSIKAKYLSEWLKEYNPLYPNIYVWGAGRLSRRRSDLLRQYGINILKYIDLKSGENTIQYERIPEEGNIFIVSYVANRGARERIRSYLNEKGFIEGNHFVMAS
ncbi:MAG: glycosyltransferase family 2 protein [Ekhidna sp.]|nr:glycosyltransferase family 2 protein [Ekhidna sp.]